MTTLLVLLAVFLGMGAVISLFAINPVLTVGALLAIFIIMVFPIQVITIFGIIFGGLAVAWVISDL